MIIVTTIFDFGREAEPIGHPSEESWCPVPNGNAVSFVKSLLLIIKITNGQLEAFEVP